ncbi:MAG: DUF2970 domain-containing protein [Pseudomonadota bacterium]
MNKSPLQSDQDQPNQADRHEENIELTFVQVTVSVLASMFGVQSDKNRIRDFKYGKPKHFIAGGIIFVVLFLLFVFCVVQIVLG